MEGGVDGRGGGSLGGDGVVRGLRGPDRESMSASAMMRSPSFPFESLQHLCGYAWIDLEKVRKSFQSPPREV